MRCTPASRAKAKRVPGPPLHDAPRVGSRLRANWDLLQGNRGAPVELIGTPSSIKNALICLTDFYGLDVRHVQRGYHRDDYDRCRPSLYLLAGEWFGRVYVDYIAERLASQDQSEAA